MLIALLLGSAMIVTTIIVETIVLGLAIHLLSTQGNRLIKFTVLPRTIIFLSILCLWLMFGITVAVWLWAILFLLIGEFETISSALYFSIVTATTLGYGDVVLSERWQLLSGLLAANGLFLFSLNTAFLFEALRRLSDAK